VGRDRGKGALLESGDHAVDSPRSDPRVVHRVKQDRLGAQRFRGVEAAPHGGEHALLPALVRDEGHLVAHARLVADLIGTGSDDGHHRPDPGAGEGPADVGQKRLVADGQEGLRSAHATPFAGGQHDGDDPHSSIGTWIV